jgi:hypothetical protein
MGYAPLRILFISGYFPPKAPMGAVRPGKLAEYWREQGQDVRVVAIALAPQEWAHVQAPGVPTHYIGYEEPGQIVTRVASAIRQLPIRRSRALSDTTRSIGSGGLPRSGIPNRTSSGLAELYRQALHLPDRYRSWIKPAVHTVQSWQATWKPDLIYSSGPPNSGHIAARILARRMRVPWIAEIRDAWMDNPNGDPHWLIEPVFNRQARGTLRHAAGLVTVTEADRKQMAAAFPMPVVLSYNGFDPRDFEQLGTVPMDRDRLTILHAGAVYSGRRDPTPLFKAISALGPQAGKVRCLFYGDEAGTIASLAESCAVLPSVETGGILRRSEILALERSVDVLLECHWQDSAGDGVIPGKLFEYIGARRPILSLGSTTAEAAVIVRETGVGLASNAPEEIRVSLLNWLDQKSRFGRIPDLPNTAGSCFERAYQFGIINKLIQKIVYQSRAEPGSAREQSAY